MKSQTKTKTMEFDPNDSVKIRGQNYSAAISNTNSPVLNLFFKVTPDMEREKLDYWLTIAWKDDPELTLKVIFNLGNVRKDGGGKQDAVNFSRAMIWLWHNHPQTVLLNLEHIPEHVSLKMLLDTCMYILHDKLHDSPYNLEIALKKRYQLKEPRRRHNMKTKWRRKNEEREDRQEGAKNDAELQKIRKQINKKYKQDTKQDKRKLRQNIHNHLKVIFGHHNKTTEAALLKDCSGDIFKHGENYLNTNKPSQAIELRDRVASIFAKGLAKEFRDMVEQRKHASMGAEREFYIGGLYGKWAPTKNKAHDKAINIVLTIIPMLLLEVKDMIKEHKDLAKRKKELLELVELQSKNPGKSIADLYKNSETLRIAAGSIYQSVFLASLRKAAEIPEHFVGNSDFEKVNYARMASRCRLIWGEKVFAKNDKKGYNDFLLQAAKNSLLYKTGAKVNVGSLLPHELTKNAIEMKENDPRKAEVNLQWNTLVRSMKEKSASSSTDESTKPANDSGKKPAPAWNRLNRFVQPMKGKNASSFPDKSAQNPIQVGNWLPMCDVSSSMNGTPMHAAVALSLLMAESSCIGGNSIWGGKIMTFHQNPQMCRISGIHKTKTVEDIQKCNSLNEISNLLGDLKQKVEEVMALDCGMNTDIEKAWNLVLKICKENHLPQEVVSSFKLCIFSDMEFDQAKCSHTPWETMHETIEKKFRKAGYKEMPTIIYWNLRDSVSIPVNDTNKPGVVLLSGYSAGLMRKFLSGDLELEEDAEEEMDTTENKVVVTKQKLTQMEVLQKIVGTEMYDKLEVADDDMET